MKEQAGKLTGAAAIEGRAQADQAKGGIPKQAGELKEKVKDAFEAAPQRSPDRQLFLRSF